MLTRRSFLGGALAAAPRRPPNIVVILADDLGFSDIGCYGGEIETPNLDRLAHNGVRFTQFYNCARCCPTRSSLLTGLYNHQAGVGHMVQDRGIPSYQGFLNDRCVTIAEALRPAGYQTLMSGKWHVGEDRPHWPTDRGFDRYFGLISGASNYWRLDLGRKMALDGEPWEPPADGSFYMTDAITDHAVRMIREARPQPFFLYLAYTSPHWPLHAWPDDIDKYRGRYMKGWDRLRNERHERQIAMGIVDKRWPLSPRAGEAPAWDDVSNKEDWDLRMAVYAAQVDRMDRGIGRVLDQIRRSEQWDNTVILFLADNGGCAEINIGSEKQALNPKPGPADSFTSYRQPWANASNTPFRWWKQLVHEGGIATPLIAHWPKARGRSNRLVHTPGHVIDIMPTALNLAGAGFPAEFQGRRMQAMEGRSVVPALQGDRLAPLGEICWEHQGHRAIRRDDWKLVSRFQGDWELYNLKEDRTELNDLSAADPALRQELIAAWTRWAARCGVQPWDQVRDRNPA
jgi:arylsulfatase A-like enzyme